MKKPKIRVTVRRLRGWDGWTVSIWLDHPDMEDGWHLGCQSEFGTKEAAREWAKDWCRTVGAALMEKGK